MVKIRKLEASFAHTPKFAHPPLSPERVPKILPKFIFQYPLKHIHQCLFFKVNWLFLMLYDFYNF